MILAMNSHCFFVQYLPTVLYNASTLCCLCGTNSILIYIYIYICVCVCFKRGYILASKPFGHFTIHLIQVAIELIVVVVVVVVVVVGVVVTLLV